MLWRRHVRLCRRLELGDLRLLIIAEADGPGDERHRKNIIELGADVDRKFNPAASSKARPKRARRHYPGHTTVARRRHSSKTGGACRRRFERVRREWAGRHAREGLDARQGRSREKDAFFHAAALTACSSCCRRFLWCRHQGEVMASCVPQRSRRRRPRRPSRRQIAPWRRRPSWPSTATRPSYQKLYEARDY